MYKYLFFIMFGLAVGLAAAECLFMLRFHFEYAQSTVRPDRDRLECCNFDPILGYSGVPGGTGTMLKVPFALNSKGYRSSEFLWEKQPGTFRVILSGDSQAWGYGLADQDTPHNQLYNIANSSGRSDVEFINFGVPGYGTDQELLSYLIDGHRLDADALVLIYFHDNDLSEIMVDHAWGVGKPRFELIDRKLCIAGIPVAGETNWPLNGKVLLPNILPPLLVHILRYTHTYEFFEGRAFPFRTESSSSKRATQDFYFNLLQKYTPCAETISEAKEARRYSDLELLDALLSEFTMLLDDKPFIIIMKPNRNDLEQRLITVEYEKVLEIAARHSHDVIDLLPLLTRRCSELSSCFLDRQDSHLSVAGTKIMTQETWAALAKYLPSRPNTPYPPR